MIAWCNKNTCCSSLKPQTLVELCRGKRGPRVTFNSQVLKSCKNRNWFNLYRDFQKTESNFCFLLHSCWWRSIAPPAISNNHVNVRSYLTTAGISEPSLGGGFKYVFFSSLFGEDFQFWLIFFRWVVQPPTRSTLSFANIQIWWYLWVESRGLNGIRSVQSPPESLDKNPAEPRCAQSKCSKGLQAGSG